MTADLIPRVSPSGPFEKHGGAFVETVTGDIVDNTDPANPIVNGVAALTAGTNIEITGTATHPIVSFVPDLVITSFSTPVTLIEVGNSLVNPTFSATYNRTVSAATLTDNQGNPAVPFPPPFTSVTSPHTFTKAGIGQSVTWTDTATAGTSTALRSVSATWGALNFHGAANDPGVITAAFVQGLSSSVLSTSRVIPNFSQTVSGTEYLWYCYPTSEGVATLFDNTTGFQIDTIVETTTLAVTNAFGVTLNYTVMRSTFQLNSTVVVRVQ